MGGVVTGNGINMMIRQNRGSNPKGLNASNLGLKRAYPNAPATEHVTSCAMDSKAKAAWRKVEAQSAAKSNTPAATAAAAPAAKAVEYKDGEDGTMHARPGNH
jgi:hypothetical protein